jgi:D-glycerate 3-kinase
MIREWIKEKLAKSQSKPLMVAVSGAQGIGKTTLTGQLVESFAGEGIKCVSISVDDFYLTREEQQNLTDSTANTYLKQRGYPGTHDVALATDCLFRLKRGEPCEIPRYDKSKYNGLGDRAGKDEWLAVHEAQDVILFEGWFLGFEPVQSPPNNDLLEINEALSQYRDCLSLFDYLIYLKPQEIEYVVDWRVEAEKNMRALGKSGMTDDQTREYILKFLPAYGLYRDTVQADLTVIVKRDRSHQAV